MISQPSHITDDKIINKMANQEIYTIASQQQYYKQYIILDPKLLRSELIIFLINGAKNKAAPIEVFINIDSIYISLVGGSSGIGGGGV